MGGATDGSASGAPQAQVECSALAVRRHHGVARCVARRAPSTAHLVHSRKALPKGEDSRTILSMKPGHCSPQERDICTGIEKRSVANGCGSAGDSLFGTNTRPVS